MPTLYVRRKRDGSWGYSTVKPTDPNEPVITKEQVEAMRGTETAGSEPLNASFESRMLGTPPEEQGQSAPERKKFWFGQMVSGVGEERKAYHYTELYSPADARKYQKLYQTRSKIIMDDELAEDERQESLDEVDAMISRIPVMSPEMKEPTAQQMFDASIVTASDGTKYTRDKSGSYKPLELGKAAVEEQKAYQERYGKVMDRLMTANAKFKEGDDDWMSFSKMRIEAKTITDDHFGKLPSEEEIEGFNTELGEIWNKTIAELDQKQSWRGRAKEAFMISSLGEFIKQTVALGLGAAGGAAYFLHRWMSAADNSDKWENAIVPAMADRFRRMAKSAPYLKETEGAEPFGEITAGGETVDVGADARAGGTVTVFKNGKKYFLPAEQLEQALTEGYKLVK